VITPEFVGRMLNTIAEGLLVSGCVWLALRWFKPLNSGTRFAVWFSTMLAIVALPFLSRTNSVEAVASSYSQLALPSSWAIYLLVAWVAVVSVLLARLSVSLWHIAKLRRSSMVVDLTTLDPELQNIWTETSRRIELRTSDKVRVPAALGFFRPAVIVPAWTLEELPAEELKVILLHELAHLHRWDDWTNLAQKIVKSLFFFHPAVWWIESKLMLEREMACDDLVLAQTSNPRTYAKSLISLAERVGLGKGIALAQAALGRAHQTSQRIMQILDTGRPKATRVWKPALGVVTAMSAIAIMAVPYTPNLVSFENQKVNPAPIAVANANRPQIAVPVTIKESAPIRAIRGQKAVKIKQQTRQTEMVAIEVKSGRNPLMIQAKASEVAPPAMFVVLRAVQYDESGISVWTLCVWQVPNTRAMQKQLHPEQIAKSL
jgi:beta-lactamase regulating signal transducer with metallopeptidase domain